MGVEDIYKKANGCLARFCKNRDHDARRVVLDLIVRFAELGEREIELYEMFITRVSESVLCCSYESEVESWGRIDDGPCYVDFWTPSQGRGTLLRIVFRVEHGDSLGYGFEDDVFDGDSLFAVIANLPRYVLEFERGNFEYFDM